MASCPFVTVPFIYLFIYLYDLFSLEKSLGLLKKLKTIEQFFT